MTVRCGLWTTVDDGTVWVQEDNGHPTAVRGMALRGDGQVTGRDGYGTAVPTALPEDGTTSFSNDSLQTHRKRYVRQTIGKTNKHTD